MICVRCVSSRSGETAVCVWTRFGVVCLVVSVVVYVGEFLIDIVVVCRFFRVYGVAPVVVFIVLIVVVVVVDGFCRFFLRPLPHGCGDDAPSRSWLFGRWFVVVVGPVVLRRRLGELRARFHILLPCGQGHLRGWRRGCEVCQVVAQRCRHRPRQREERGRQASAPSEGLPRTYGLD